jgi:hypothetical protein
MTKIEKLMEERSKEERLMTRDQVREGIFLSIIEWEPVDGHGDPTPVIKEVKQAKELANSLLNSLNAKGLLIKMYDDD